MVIDLPLRAAGLAGDDPSAEAGYDPRLDGLCGLGGLSLGAKLGELEQFARLMQTQGQAVEATRMLFDMPYANNLLQAGSRSDGEPLRRLAQRLHAQYQRAGHWLGLH